MQSHLLSLALRANTGNHIIYIFNLEIVGERYNGYFLRGDAHGTPTHTTGGMDMTTRCMRGLARCRVRMVEAIFLLAAAVFETMQQMLLLKKDKRAKNRTAVDGIEKNI